MQTQIITEIWSQTIELILTFKKLNPKLKHVKSPALEPDAPSKIIAIHRSDEKECLFEQNFGQDIFLLCSGWLDYNHVARKCQEVEANKWDEELALNKTITGLASWISPRKLHNMVT